MKKILTSLLILPILFTAACGSNNHDANATPAEYFNYTIIEQQKYVVIDGYIGPEKNVVIPKKIKDLPVRSIKPGAFEKSDIISIALPDTIETITERSFTHCSELKSVKVGKNVKTIGEEAFNKCTLLEEIELPKGLEKIDNKAFSYCESLKSITIPGTVESLGASIFDYAGIEELNLEDGIKNLGVQSFAGPENLTSVTIPASVTDLGTATFGYTLKEAHFLGNAPQEFGMMPLGTNAVVYYKKGTSGWDNTALREEYQLIEE